MGKAKAMVALALAGALGLPPSAGAAENSGARQSSDTPASTFAPATPVSPMTPDTPAVPTVPKERLGRWIQSGGRWWFMLEKGKWLSNCIALVEGEPYAFDADGWMARGWICLNGLWYYAGGSGILRTGWQDIDGVWYYLHPGGAHLNPYAMHTEWLDLASEGRFFFGADGAMQRGWLTIAGARYYFFNSGGMALGWQKIGDHWYYFGESWSGTAGQMRTGLTVVGEETFCFNTTSQSMPVGAMAEGWVQDSVTQRYLYFYPSWGAMARDTRIDGYYVNAEGYWEPGR